MPQRGPRFALLALLLAGATSAGEAGWTMPAEMRAALDRVVADAVAAGLPDARGATLHQGELKVRWKQDGEQDEVEIDGLHARLRDGRWLVGLSSLLAGAEAGVTVDAAGLKAVEPGKLREVRSPHMEGFDIEAMLAQQGDHAFAGMDAEQVPMVKAAMRRGMPLVMATQGFGESGPALLHLLRLGVPDAEYAAVFAGMQNWDEGPTDSTPPPLVLGGQDERWELLAARHQKAAKEGGMRLPPPDQGLRRVAMQVFRAALISPPQTPAEAMPSERAAAGALALLPKDDASGRAEIALLVARAAIPEKPPAGADLPTRLAAWTWRRFVPGDDEDGPDFSFGNRFAFTRTLRATGDDGQDAAPKPLLSEADRDGLFALLADPRPCRWMDGETPRTLGDNALRALRVLFSCDPRSFIGRDPAAPWTAEERAATAKALQAWWAANRARGIDAILVDTVPRMAGGDLAALLADRPADRQTPLLDALARHWATLKAAPEWEDAHLVAVLVQGKAHAALAAAVAAWPVAGEHRRLLATWQRGRGEHRHFDALVAEAIAARPGAVPPEERIPSPFGMDGAGLSGLIPLIAVKPRPDDLLRVLTVLGGAVEAPAFLDLLSPLRAYQGSPLLPLLTGEAPDRLPRGVRADRHGGPAAQALPLAILATQLADDRAVPAAWLAEHRQHLAMFGQRFGEDGAPAKPREPQHDLRVSDIAGAGAWQQLMREGLRGDDLAGDPRGLMLDVTAARAARDAVLARLRALLLKRLPEALKAAGLPEALPAAAPAAKGDDKALF